MVYCTAFGPTHVLPDKWGTVHILIWQVSILTRTILYNFSCETCQQLHLGYFTTFHLTLVDVYRWGTVRSYISHVSGLTVAHCTNVVKPHHKYMKILCLYWGTSVLSAIRTQQYIHISTVPYCFIASVVDTWRICPHYSLKIDEKYSYCSAHFAHVYTTAVKLFLQGIIGVIWRNLWAPWSISLIVQQECGGRCAVRDQNVAGKRSGPAEFCGQCLEGCSIEMWRLGLVVFPRSIWVGH